MPLKLFQNSNLARRNSFSHICSTITLIPLILAPKFSESFSLSFHAFIIHVSYILFDWVIVCLMIRWSRYEAAAFCGILRPNIWGLLWKNHLGEGFIDQDQLERCLVKQEHNQHMQVYNTICISSSRSYYKLGSHIKYKRDLKPKYTLEDDSEFAEAIFLNV
jgi:hypothetical protein